MSMDDEDILITPILSKERILYKGFNPFKVRSGSSSIQADTRISYFPWRSKKE